VASLNDLETGFDFTDETGDDGDASAALAGEAAARAARRLATGTIPRLELASPAMPEPPDSVRATTRMSVEEVLELRAVSLEARRKAARIETEPAGRAPLRAEGHRAGLRRRGPDWTARVRLTAVSSRT
jgi:hypothetical protein